MIKRLSVWCAFGLLVACNNNPTREPQADSAEVITDNTDANLQLPDQQDSVLFNKLVVTGTFRQFQVSEAVGEMGWTGIFRNDTGYYAVPTQLFATRVPGAGGDTIDMEIAADNRDSLLVAVSSKLGLPSGYIKTASLPEDPCITAGKRLRLKFEDQLYELFATGDTTRPNAVSRYRLYISTERNGEKRTQLIGAVPQFQVVDGMCLLFAGDMDGDGFLDLLIDTSADERFVSPTLYLSRFAETPDVLKVVGYFNLAGL